MEASVYNINAEHKIYDKEPLKVITKVIWTKDTSTESIVIMVVINYWALDY